MYDLHVLSISIYLHSNCTSYDKLFGPKWCTSSDSTHFHQPYCVHTPIMTPDVKFISYMN